MAVAEPRYSYLKTILAFSDQNKIKKKKITRQGSIRLPDADFFWIILSLKLQKIFSEKLGFSFLVPNFVWNK